MRAHVMSRRSARLRVFLSEGRCSDLKSAVHVTTGGQPEHRRLVLRRPHARSPGNHPQGQGAHGHAP
eukprot:13322800-Alexandrium_andersonii.AAC.1